MADLLNAGVVAAGVAYEGKTSDAVLETAEREQPDIIVISGIGPTGARDYLVASEAERIVRHATVPVFVVR